MEREMDLSNFIHVRLDDASKDMITKKKIISLLNPLV